MALWISHLHIDRRCQRDGTLMLTLDKMLTKKVEVNDQDFKGEDAVITYYQLFFRFN